MSMAASSQAVGTVFSGTGATVSDIQSVVDAFRADLGANNGVGPCGGGCLPGVGRREINWDAVLDAFASGGANPFPGNFFNLATGSAAGRIRGAEFSTTGSFEVSADSDSNGDGNPGPVATLFGNHHSDNSDDFAAFSAERIFGLVGANQLDVRFSEPGSPGVSAFTRGFGVVFTDVESAVSTKLEYFDAQDNLLHSSFAPAFPNAGDETFKSFSFLGVTFDSPSVARVRVTSGGRDLDLGAFGEADAVPMDDFIYGEPTSVPEPGTMALAAIGLGGMLLWRRRRSR
ncbi:MAG: PEP-CTERM sorting domain-containing protein [Pirellulales bacterium]